MNWFGHVIRLFAWLACICLPSCPVMWKSKEKHLLANGQPFLDGVMSDFTSHCLSFCFIAAWPWTAAVHSPIYSLTSRRSRPHANLANNLGGLVACRQVPMEMAAVHWEVRKKGESRTQKLEFDKETSLNMSYKHYNLSLMVVCKETVTDLVFLTPQWNDS